MLRKRLDLQEILKRPQKVFEIFHNLNSYFTLKLFKIKKKLRIFISHQYPIRLEADPMGLIDDDQLYYWELRIEGRLLDDVS